MPFDFLQYIAPTWYFNLKPRAGDIPYFTDYRKLTEATRILIDYDAGYNSESCSLWDASYQAWHKGIIETDPEMALLESDQQPSVSDNYRFIRKYFHPLWSWYVLALRLVTLHSPFREISGFRSQRRVHRVDLYKNVYPHEQAFKSYESALLQQAPKVSVIIPTLNRYPFLKDVLHDLEQQYYKNFEVIIVDQSEPYHSEFYVQFQLDLKLIRQEEKALWLARNTAIKAAKGEFISMYEDDVRVSGDWLSNHLKCLDFFKSDISAGVFFPAGSSIPVGRSFFRWADQFATGNACLKKEIFNKIGLFDRQFERQRMGDGEFGLRAYLAGFKSVSNPYAWCIDVKAPSGGLRQMGSWDAFRPKSLFAPRPVPSVLYFYRNYFGEKAAFWGLLIALLPSIVPYRYKHHHFLILLGSILGLVLFPFILFQAIRSWHYSSERIKSGKIIGRL